MPSCDFSFLFTQLILQTRQPLPHHSHFFPPFPQTYQTPSSCQNQLPSQKPLHRFMESMYVPTAVSATLTPASTAVKFSTCPACCAGTTASASRSSSSFVSSLKREAGGPGCSFTRRAAAPSAALCAAVSLTAWRT